MYKILAGIAALAALYLGAFLHGRSTVQQVVTTEEKVIRTVAQVQTQVVYKDRVITKVVIRKVAADGATTVVEKETTRDTDEKQVATRDEKKQETTSHSTELGTAAAQPQYSLGLVQKARYTEVRRLIPDVYTGVSLGYRLFSDVWLDSVIFKEEATIGVSIKFGGK